LDLARRLGWTLGLDGGTTDGWTALKSASVMGRIATGESGLERPPVPPRLRRECQNQGALL
jgi:hypothetical protein